jgi:hypothetical protein
MTPDETEATVARAICRVLLNGGDPDQPAMRWNGTELELQDFPAWRDHLDEARAAIAALAGKEES